MVVKSFNKRQQMKIFANNGFRTKRTNGSHQVLENSAGQTIIISAHGQKMSDTAFNKTIKQFNLVF
jgi:predicted RNA binding protein YcfA (HicA-like mRNA interferase family)